MALRQPSQQQRRPIQRPISIPHSLSAHDATGNTRVDESQEWILFSPALDHEPSLTSHTSQTQRTHHSDFGSLETGVQSDRDGDNDQDGDVTCQGTDLDEDGEDMDSLDDGLHAFHAPFSLDQSGGAVLPNHDGLGSFAALYHNDSVQEHLWQFERYNPNRRRTQRRRSSVQRRLDALDDHEVDKQEERRLRIEKWRLEQSRAVLEEIEKETRRRKRRLSIVSRTASTAAPKSDSETESFWQRITRKVIKDLMGLDDNTLSVIFGEELAPDALTTPTQQSPLTAAFLAHQDRAWENRLLNRIARELGVLAHQLADHDRQDRAFTTYTSNKALEDRPTQSQPRQIQQPASTVAHSADDTNSAAPLFAPTFANPPLSPTAEVDTSLWGIPEEPKDTTREAKVPVHDKNHDAEYWERDLDIGAVFRYLRSRFSSRPPSPQPQQQEPQQPQQGILPPDWASPTNAGPTASALGTSPESRRRADLIRRHHPLVSHAASVSAARRRESMLLHSIIQRRAASSSCASQSTKRTRSGGSRRYWDFPSSTGSVVSVCSAGDGVLGTWGEV